MKGFKSTGRGPKMGHSFGAKHGFTHSGTNKQNVRGYSRGVPKVATKTKFASGGMVTAPMASGDSSVTKRAKPVTSFDSEHGGKSPLRPGFNKGGKACYADGGKVATTGAAIKMMKELMKRGNSAGDAARKAATRYGVSQQEVSSQVAPPAPASKPLLAGGGSIRAAVGRAAPAALAGPKQVPGALERALGAGIKQRTPATAVSTAARPGMGSFNRRPLFGSR